MLGPKPSRRQLAPPQNLWRIDQDRLHLAFHEGQQQAWDTDRRFIAVLAGSQGGKTSFGPWWLWREIDRMGAGDYLAVTSSFDLFQLKMLPTLRETFEHILGIGRWWAGDRILELRDPVTGEFWARRSDDRMWGRIILRSAVAKSGLESATAKAAWLDEAGQDEFRVDTWEAVLRRLSLVMGRTLITTTIYNLGWLKSEVYDRWVKGDPDYAVVQFKSTINPSFPLEEFERARRTMVDWKFRMFYLGEYTRPPGMIYHDFERTTHVVAPFAIPPEWPRTVGVDFGAVNTALVWVAENPATGVYYVYRESLEGEKTTEEHAKAALKLASSETVVHWLGGAPSETQQRWDWGNAGVPVRQPFIVDVESGIDAVISLLKTRRLYFFETCTGLLDEIGGYRRKVDQYGNVLDEIHDKNTYHRLDALRYLTTGLRHGQVLVGIG